MFTNFEIMGSASQSKVYFFFEKVSISLKNRTQLKKRIESVFQEEKLNLDKVCYVFCRDRKILELNRKFLKHDYYTDILTFKLSDKQKPIVGEIYIRIDR